MLPKANRVNKKTVDLIFKEGKFINSPNFTFKFVKSESLLPQISILAPKNIAKKATDRNSLRRLGYRALQKYINLFPPKLSGVLIFRKSGADIIEIEKDIESILKKI